MISGLDLKKIAVFKIKDRRPFKSEISSFDDNGAELGRAEFNFGDDFIFFDALIVHNGFELMLKDLFGIQVKECLKYREEHEAGTVVYEYVVTKGPKPFAYIASEDIGQHYEAKVEWVTEYGRLRPLSHEVGSRS